MSGASPGDWAAEELELVSQFGTCGQCGAPLKPWMACTDEGTSIGLTCLNGHPA